jgi:penicillin-insensitive murein DD-endopeptidase
LTHSRRTAAATLLSASLAGCLGSISPLAPGLRGSVGLPNQGVLTDGVELPESGVGYVRYRRQSDHYFGVPRLVAAIEKAAADVARGVPGDVPLFVGDLSARTGGKIPNHASHRTGRDVDLLYFVTNVYGKPTNSPGFVSVGSDGLAQIPTTGRFLYLDADREWRLVRSLLVNSEIEVLWMFVSRDVEALLIMQARALGEANELVWRAEQVLHQPRDSSPHDDHMHLRIACTLSESLDGCEGGGPHWPWFGVPNLSEQTEANRWAMLRTEPSPSESLATHDNGNASDGSSSSR